MVSIKYSGNKAINLITNPLLRQDFVSPQCHEQKQNRFIADCEKLPRKKKVHSLSTQKFPKENFNKNYIDVGNALKWVDVSIHLRCRADAMPEYFRDFLITEKFLRQAFIIACDDTVIKFHYDDGNCCDVAGISCLCQQGQFINLGAFLFICANKNRFKIIREFI